MEKDKNVANTKNDTSVEEIENQIKRLDTDLTEKQSALTKLNKELDEKQRKLEALNKELDGFADKKNADVAERQSLTQDIVRLKAEAVRLKAAAETAETEYVRKKAELDKAFSERKAETDALIAEKEKAIESVAKEREAVARSIGELLSTLRSQTEKSGNSAAEIYKTIIADGTEQVNAAVSDAADVIAEIQKQVDLYKKQRDAVVAESVKKRGEILSSAEELRAKKIAELEAALKEKQDRLYDDIESVSAERLSLSDDRRKLESELRGFDSAVEKRVKDEYVRLSEEIENLKAELASTQEALDAKNREYSELKRRTNIQKCYDLEDERKTNAQLQSRIKDLESRIVSDELVRAFKEKAMLYDAAQREFEDNREKYARLESEVERLRHAAGLNKTLRDIIESNECSIEELKTQLERFRDKEYSVEHRMKPITEYPIFVKTHKRYDGGEEVNHPLALYKSDGAELDEIEWLDNVANGIASENFVFGRRLLEAFHTCIKTSIWSPITVLAGVSGTGKSELPRLYSQYGGLNFLNMPVKPDWDSPSSMFGYYNSLEKRFEAKEAIRAMYQMQADEDFKKQLAMFLLDEMNLAYVELYFSDMLSKLEENRGRKSSDAVVYRVDLGADVKPLELKLTHNMFWVGTMNEDETTKSLSDKVIDRSNIIVFPRPKKLQSRKLDYKSYDKGYLKLETWGKWNIEYSELVGSEKFDAKLEHYKDIVQRVSNELENGGRALGHRVWQSI